MWCSLIPVIESGVSASSAGRALLSSYLTSRFLHVALGSNPLSSHSRFSNLQIIERSYRRAVRLPAGSLGGLLCDLFDPLG